MSSHPAGTIKWAGISVVQSLKTDFKIGFRVVPRQGECEAGISSLFLKRAAHGGYAIPSGARRECICEMGLGPLGSLWENYIVRMEGGGTVIISGTPHRGFVICNNVSSSKVPVGLRL
ncbi:hypothetical protein SLA2020_052010 [Shorea laevis]